MLKYLLPKHGIKFQECGVFNRLRANVANDAAVAAASSTVLSVDDGIAVVQVSIAVSIIHLFFFFTHIFLKKG